MTSELCVTFEDRGLLTISAPPSSGQAGALEFRTLPPPTDDEIGDVLARIAARGQRLLRLRLRPEPRLDPFRHDEQGAGCFWDQPNGSRGADAGAEESRRITERELAVPLRQEPRHALRDLHPSVRF